MMVGMYFIAQMILYGEMEQVLAREVVPVEITRNMPWFNSRTFSETTIAEY